MVAHGQDALRVAFVLEQTLGHVTHSKNLADVVLGRSDIDATWLPIAFDARGATRLVPLLRSNWSVRASWRARRALGPVVAAGACDALVFHTQVTALFSLDLMRRLPTIVSLDATPINYDTVGPYYGHRAAGRGIIDRQKYRLNRAVFHAAAGLVTWSDWARLSLVRDYGVEDDRIRVLAPGASPAYFKIGEERADRTTGPLQHKDRVRLLFVGGDFQRKGGPLLLECMQSKLGERCELHIVTQQSVAPAPNVYVYHGVAPNSTELVTLFRTADVFVLPSMGECLAVVLMEATAAGLPVVTTTVGALGEAVTPGKSGFVVEPGDGRGLREALTRLVADRELRQRMGRTGHELAARKFDAERNNQELLDMVRQVAEDVRASRRQTAPKRNGSSPVSLVQK